MLDMSKYRKFVVDTFISLAEIPSPLAQLRDVIIELIGILSEKAGYKMRCANPMGESVDFMNNAAIVWTIIPATPGYEQLPCKGVDAHIDTVGVPAGTKKINVVVDAESGVIKSDGRTILGADDKAGVAAIITALHILKTQEIPHGPIQVMLPGGEESGMNVLRNWNFSNLEAASMVCFDGEDPETIWNGCAGKIKYRATFKGRQAHGFRPETGLNAAIMAAKALAEAETQGMLGAKGNWGRFEAKGTHFGTLHTVSQISGGAEFPSTNVVPGTCVISGEFRGFDQDMMRGEFNQVQKLFRRVAESCRSEGEHFKGSVTWESETPYDPFVLNPEHPLIRELQTAMMRSRVIVPPTVQTTMGATHGNVYSMHGVPSVVIGAGGHNAHQTDEYLIIEEMLKATEILVNYLRAPDQK